MWVWCCVMDTMSRLCIISELFVYLFCRSFQALCAHIFGEISRYRNDSYHYYYHYLPLLSLGILLSPYLSLTARPFISILIALDCLKHKCLKAMVG